MWLEVGRAIKTKLQRHKTTKHKTTKHKTRKLIGGCLEMGAGKKNRNRCKENLGEFRYVHWIDCGDIFMGVFICLNVLNCTC